MPTNGRTQLNLDCSRLICWRVLGECWPVRSHTGQPHGRPPDLKIARASGKPSRFVAPHRARPASGAARFGGAGNMPFETYSQLSCHCTKYPADFDSQCRQVLLHHGPNGIEVHAEVGMNKSITRSRDLPPGNGGFSYGQVGTEVLDRLTDDFELTDHRAFASSGLS